DNILVRSGYAEMDGFLKSPRLQPLYVRAGRMFRYGPAVAHFDGALVGYDHRLFSLAAYAGRRVGPFRTRAVSRRVIGGPDARVDLGQPFGVPLPLSASLIAFDTHSHVQGGATYQWTPNIQLGADTRLLDGKLAREALSLRARISEVTTVY